MLLAPNVELLPTSVVGNEGDEVELFCKASGGNPDPSSYNFMIAGKTMKNVCCLWLLVW